MKKLLFVLMILVITAGAVSALDIFNSQLLTKIGISADEIEAIQNIQYQAEQTIRMSNAEINILKAQLEKLLIQEHPDMDKVRKTIEATLKWRIKSEMANVEARVQIRERLGTKNWEDLLQLRKRIQAQQRTQSDSGKNNQATQNSGAGRGGNTGKSDSKKK